MIRVAAAWLVILVCFSLLYITQHMDTYFKRSLSFTTPGDFDTRPPIRDGPDTMPSVPICTSRQRLDYIRRQIATHQMTQESHASDHKFMMYVFAKKRFAYCPVGKCATRTMKCVLYKLATNHTNRVDISTMKPSHVLRVLRQNGIQKLENPPPATFQDYRKLAIIRNPIDRIVSAYTDKILHRNQSDGGRAFAEWQQAHERHSNATTTTFQRFVTGLLSTTLRDRHWNPFNNVCHFDQIDYDDVIRIETFQHDMEPVLVNYFKSNWSIVTHSLGNVNRKKTVETPTQHVTPRYLAIFEQIPKQDLIALKDMYRLNMLLYGYDFDVDTLTTRCMIRTEDGHVCC